MALLAFEIWTSANENFTQEVKSASTFPLKAREQRLLTTPFSAVWNISAKHCSLFPLISKGGWTMGKQGETKCYVNGGLDTKSLLNIMNILMCLYFFFNANAFYIAMIFWQLRITFYPFLYHKANETVN